MQHGQKKRKFGLILGGFLLLALAVSLAVYLIFIRDYEKEALLRLGYDESTVDLIRERLPDDTEPEQINDLLTLPLQENLPEILNHPDFQPEKLQSYLEYLVNLENYQLDAVIYLVNHEVSAPYSELLAKLIKEPYFLLSRLERYLAYDTTKPPEIIIQEVNSNLDRPYYTDPEPVDIAKGNLLLVNKYYNFDENYTPDNLVKIAAAYDNNTGDQVQADVYAAFVEMADAAAAEGLSLRNNSAYRSFQTQQNLYNRYLTANGEAYAEDFAARPGFSEHQAGLALDIGVPTGKVVGSFEYTPEFTWLLENAHNFGFILRYPKGKEHLTGYHYEPWHYRYVGPEVATYIHEQNLTLEEYYAVFVEGQQD